MISRLRQAALKHGELIEDVSLANGHRFCVKLPDFDQLRKGVIWKPLGYIENGWQHVVTPAIPKRVLNLYLQQPHQRLYRLDPRYIADKCQRQVLYRQRQPIGPLNTADVSSALRMLIQLGLFAPEEDGLRIDWPTFTRPAPTIPSQRATVDPREHRVFVESYAIDSIRAERALELLMAGNYEIDVHFADIFRDLAYIQHEDDYHLLRKKVHTRRSRLPGPNRWKETWRVFHNELKRRASEIRFPKVILNLGEAAQPNTPLIVTPFQTTRPVSAIVMVARVERSWYVQDARPIQLEVAAFDRILFTHSIGLSDGEVRFSLPSDRWTADLTELTLRARSEQPLPGVQVEAWVEAKLQR
ncbi:MAG TPA: hypothetical protein VMT34_08120 [Aggregatilineales bacterium]|nr:hypothetical protein [Aggregatilineales bacterium]